MPARIRLQRYGKKGKPFYHIVIADGRAPRDGKFIENIGTYNPLTIPATIELDIDKSVQWLKNGATPSDTAKAILSYKGVLYKYHLQKGVAKGALTQEQAEAKFNTWLADKEERINNKIKAKELAHKEAKKKALNKEIEVSEAREKEYMAKLAKLAEKEAKEQAKQEPEVIAETLSAAEITEAPINNEPVAEIAEEVKAPAIEDITPLATDEVKTDVSVELPAEASDEVKPETTEEKPE